MRARNKCREWPALFPSLSPSPSLSHTQREREKRECVLSRNKRTDTRLLTYLLAKGIGAACGRGKGIAHVVPAAKLGQRITVIEKRAATVMDHHNQLRRRRSSLKKGRHVETVGEARVVAAGEDGGLANIACRGLWPCCCCGRCGGGGTLIGSGRVSGLVLDRPRPGPGLIYGESVGGPGPKLRLILKSL